MCVTNSKAILSSTVGYVGTTKAGTSVMAYQMKAKNLSEDDNVMIIQLPVKSNLILHDTTTYHQFLNDLVEEAGHNIYDPEFGVLIEKSLRSRRPTMTRTKVGIYDVVYFKDAQNLLNLNQIYGEDLPIKVSTELINFYEKYYRDYTLICVKFSNKVEMSSQPILFEYIKLSGYPDNYFPAIDNGNDSDVHEGLPRKSKIKRDHTLFFPANNGMRVHIKASPLIEQTVGWHKIYNHTENCDFSVNNNKLKLINTLN